MVGAAVVLRQRFAVFHLGPRGTALSSRFERRRNIAPDFGPQPLGREVGPDEHPMS